MQKACLILVCTALSACGTQPLPPSPTHIQQSARPQEVDIPDPVRQSPALAPPLPTPKAATYSVTVYKVPVQSLLFALARDARMNIDIHPGIQGEVTLNALDQTLPQILTRIGAQVDMRYAINGQSLVVSPDTPFLRNYKIDYVNVARTTTSKVSISTQIATPGAASSSGGDGNNSTTTVTNDSSNKFWELLEKNVRDILREADRMVVRTRSEHSDPAAPATAAVAGQTSVALAATAAPAAAAPLANQQVSDNERAANVIANPANGLIAVRATARQHEKVQEFIDLLMTSARRQVLVEATVVEVQLNDSYQQGINWNSVRAIGTSIGVGGFALPNAEGGQGALEVRYRNPVSRLGDLAASIRLLESFGKVKVLSSPKISVLNNQTAMLKVVDNEVYFTILASTTQGSANSPTITTYTSELHTVPVGFVMSLTPQIADSNEVTLNVRPSISRIVGYVRDPNPALSLAVVPVKSEVPVIQTREMESILKVASGQIAVMGGLMQDTLNNVSDEVPVLGRAPVIGNAFKVRNEKTSKSELVIFIRPVVIKDASIEGDYKDYRYLLPSAAADTPRPAVIHHRVEGS
jgi:MSHA biogenesis protein MshL